MPQKSNTGQLHAIQQTSPQLPFPSEFSAERNKQLKSQIKIVKRKPDPTPTDSQAESVTKSVEQSSREITSVVKKWVAELKERKSQSQQYFTPLKVS